MVGSSTSDKSTSMPSKRQAILSYSHEHDYSVIPPTITKSFVHSIPMCLLYAGVHEHFPLDVCMYSQNRYMHVCLPTCRCLPGGPYNNTLFKKAIGGLFKAMGLIALNKPPINKVL